MRQRFAISIILPCLAWAWLCVPVVRAQEKAAPPAGAQAPGLARAQAAQRLAVRPVALRRDVQLAALGLAPA